jgi:hypothetical protein
MDARAYNPIALWQYMIYSYQCYFTEDNSSVTIGKGSRLTDEVEN